jgi:hypothetical protein
MKARYAIALSLLSGIAIGAGLVHGLRAQARPPAYLGAELDIITDPEAYQ